jgi:hypothetical protein
VDSPRWLKCCSNSGSPAGIRSHILQLIFSVKNEIRQKTQPAWLIESTSIMSNLFQLFMVCGRVCTVYMCACVSVHMCVLGHDINVFCGYWATRLKTCNLIVGDGVDDKQLTTPATMFKCSFLGDVFLEFQTGHGSPLHIVMTLRISLTIYLFAAFLSSQRLPSSLSAGRPGTKSPVATGASKLTCLQEHTT